MQEEVWLSLPGNKSLSVIVIEILMGGDETAGEILHQLSTLYLIVIPRGCIKENGKEGGEGRRGSAPSPALRKVSRPCRVQSN